MKKRTYWMGIPVMVLVILLTGCKTEANEPTYTVWTATFNFSSEHSIYGTLQDGYHNYRELTTTDFEWEKANNFKNNRQYEWTEDQIFSYFIGGNFDNTVADARVKWFTSVNHGIIASRRGSSLYCILK